MVVEGYAGVGGVLVWLELKLLGKTAK